MFNIKVSPKMFDNEFITNNEFYKEAMEKQNMCQVEPQLKLGQIIVETENGTFLITMKKDGSQTVEPYNQSLNLTSRPEDGLESS